MFVSCCAAFSAAQYTAQLANIEKQLFGFEYKTDSEAVRVNRIEKYLYGKVNSANMTSRISKISTDVGIVPDSSTGAAASLGEKQKIASKPQKTAVQPAYQKEDSSVQYPVVDKIEAQVFGRDYSGENIYARVDRLEKKVYNSKSSGDLSARVDKLRLSVLKDYPDSSIASSGYGYSDDFGGYSQDYTGLSDNNDDDVFSKNDSSSNGSYNYVSPSTSKQSYLNNELTAAERTILSETFPSDNVDQRLNRLEARIFKRNFAKDEDSVRLQRIAAATVAKKSAKSYDGNKFSRNFSTGAQIGGFLLMILAMIL